MQTLVFDDTISRDQYHDLTELGLFHRILIFRSIIHYLLFIMTKLHKAFTLIEMIIVIVLVGIMLSITLNISGNQTKELRFRIARENFLANYNSFIIRAITTNSSGLNLIFAHTGTSMTLSWTNANSLYFDDVSKIDISTLNGIPDAFVSQILSFDTSQWQCVLTQVGSLSGITNVDVPLTMAYIPGGADAKCYTLSLSTCKLKRVSCS